MTEQLLRRDIANCRRRLTVNLLIGATGSALCLAAIAIPLRKGWPDAFDTVWLGVSLVGLGFGVLSLVETFRGFKILRGTVRRLDSVTKGTG